MSEKLQWWERRDYEAELARLCTLNAELLAALQFYANKDTYIGHGMQDAMIFHDWGSIARAAIEKAAKL